MIKTNKTITEDQQISDSESNSEESESEILEDNNIDETDLNKKNENEDEYEDYENIDCLSDFYYINYILIFSFYIIFITI